MSKHTFGESVDANGCSQSQLDDDGDNVVNSLDQCPNAPAGESVDSTGCSKWLDDDGDGVVIHLISVQIPLQGLV